MKIAKGHTVTLEYEGKLENGEIFDSSKHGDHSHPLTFKVGEGQVIQGFEKAVLGLSKGDKKESSILPKEAYGEYREDLKRDFPKSNLPKDMPLKKGVRVVMSAPNGMQIPAIISEIMKDIVKLDFNHPLAGKKLIFNIEVTDIE